MQLLVHHGNVLLYNQGHTFPKKRFCQLSTESYILHFYKILINVDFLLITLNKKHSSLCVIAEQMYGHCSRCLPLPVCQVWLLVCHDYWNRVLSLHCAMLPLLCLLFLICWWVKGHTFSSGKDPCTMMLVSVE
jgi:hypothetical protein